MNSWVDTGLVFSYLFWDPTLFPEFRIHFFNIFFPALQFSHKILQLFSILFHLQLQFYCFTWCTHHNLPKFKEESLLKTTWKYAVKEPIYFNIKNSDLHTKHFPNSTVGTLNTKRLRRNTVWKNEGKPNSNYTKKSI